MRFPQTEFFKNTPLARTGSRIYLCSQPLRKLYRGHTDSPGSRMHQHLLARPHAGQVNQRIVGGKECGWESRGIRERPICRDRYNQSPIGYRYRTKCPGKHSRYAIATP